MIIYKEEILKGVLEMVEHFTNVMIAIVLLILPIFNTIQLLKIGKMLTRN